jgi:hypothetical protein
MGQVMGREQGEPTIQEEFITTSGPGSIGTVGSVIQTPFIDASTKINTLVDELNEAIADNKNSDTTALLFTNEIRAMKHSARAHDVLFEENEAKAQDTGKKTRRQTLQEFVLLFFFCAYAILSAAVIMYAYIEKGSSHALTVLAGMVIIAFVVTGLIIRLA